jgi:hypothetical protein
MFHYDPESDVYGIDHAQGVMFSKVDTNPLINYFALSQLHTFQNMKSFCVDKDTDLAEYVGHSTTLHDGTVVYRFSKELLGTFETLVDFCAYYPMGNYYYVTTLADYAGVTYDDLHNYLEEGLRAWYARFKPEEDDIDDANLMEGAEGNGGLPMGAVVPVSCSPADFCLKKKTVGSEEAEPASPPAAELAAAPAAASAAAPAAAAQPRIKVHCS